MIRDQLASAHRQLGVDQTNYKALKVLPLVYVAWANGTIEDVRKARILTIAHNFDVTDRAQLLLERWLETRPTETYFRQGFRELRLLAYAPDEWEFDVEELQVIVAHAEAIARTTVNGMDQATSVTPAEQRALALLGADLGVDEGETWAQLIGELSDELPKHYLRDYRLL